jgi:hypothetical protein
MLHQFMEAQREDLVAILADYAGPDSADVMSVPTALARPPDALG